MVRPIFSKGKSKQFFVSAKVFGEAISYREEMTATGPVPGWDTIVPLVGTEAGDREKTFLTEQ